MNSIIPALASVKSWCW